MGFYDVQANGLIALPFIGSKETQSAHCKIVYYCFSECQKMSVRIPIKILKQSFESGLLAALMLEAKNKY